MQEKMKADHAHLEAAEKSVDLALDRALTRNRAQK